jgi:hypothetical protein
LLEVKVNFFFRSNSQKLIIAIGKNIAQRPSNLGSIGFVALTDSIPQKPTRIGNIVCPTSPPSLMILTPIQYIQTMPAA